MRAAWAEDVKAIEAALKRGGDPNATDNLGLTPLHALALTDDVQILRAAARMLVAAGADPQAKDFRKRTPSQMSSKLAKILSELAPPKARQKSNAMTVDVAHLFDFDRQPPVRGLYAKTIARLAPLLAGILAPKAAERWTKGRLELTVTIGKRRHVLSPRVYAHGQFDVELFPMLNALLPAGVPKLYVHNGLPSGDCYVVALSAADKKKLPSPMRLMIAKDFARARKTFESRDREMDEDE
jgi:ankyrin repeat protein